MVRHKKQTILVFIRHGESLRNKLCRLPYLPSDSKIVKILGKISDRDTPLTEAGLNQAEIVGMSLRKKIGVPDVIFHSGYLRAEQTAESILLDFSQDEIKKIEVIKDDAIRERAVGHVYNMRECDARRFFPWVEKYAELFSDFDFCPPGGESLVQVVDRVKPFIEKIKREYSDKIIFVVSHARAIQCAMYLLLGNSYNEAFARKEGPLKNCSITVFEKNPCSDGFILKEYNSVFEE